MGKARGRHSEGLGGRGPLRGLVRGRRSPGIEGWRVGHRHRKVARDFQAQPPGLGCLPWDVVLGELPPQPLPAPRSPSDYEERSHLHDSFAQMTLSLQEEAAARGECLLQFGLGAPGTAEGALGLGSAL